MTDAKLVLVTGAAGFIGAAVTRRLVGLGARVVGVDDLSAGDPARLGGLPAERFRWVEGDCRDGGLLDGLLSERPAAVLHLAGRVGVRRVLDDPELCEVENLAIGAALGASLRRAAERGVPAPRVLAASTSEVYADAAAPLSESSSLRSTRARGRWRYAASKRACEEELDDALHAVRRIDPGARDPLHLRFFNVVGPGQDGSTGMVLPRFVEAALGGAPLQVHGAGASVRTFAHVDAVADDLAALALPDRVTAAGPRRDALREATGPLNLGGTASATAIQLARTVAAAARARTGRDCALVHVDPRRAVSANFVEVAFRVPDLARARALGLVAAPWSLDEIVEDALERHVAPRPARRQQRCASPAS
ncbi:MAG: NAD-dependent epimerase/dehydratase family protein [Planctomycetota bacterium]